MSGRSKDPSRISSIRVQTKNTQRKGIKRDGSSEYAGKHGLHFPSEGSVCHFSTTCVPQKLKSSSDTSPFATVKRTLAKDSARASTLPHFRMQTSDMAERAISREYSP